MQNCGTPKTCQRPFRACNFDGRWTGSDTFQNSGRTSRRGFDFLAALLASGHALLNKRDTRAATLWIGIIWLMPALGALLYLALGVNRIRRRAIQLGVHKTLSRPVPENLGEPEHEGAEHLKHIARVVSRVATQPLTAGQQNRAARQWRRGVSRDARRD